MKAKWKFLILCSLSLFLTGCVKFNTSMDIKKNKSMNISMIVAIDKTLLGNETLYSNEYKEKFEKMGYKVSQYNENNMNGFILEKKIDNIDTVSTTNDVSFDLNKLLDENEDQKIFKVKTSFLKNTYTAKFNINVDESEIDNNLFNENDNNIFNDDDDNYFDYNYLNGNYNNNTLSNDLSEKNNLKFLQNSFPDFDFSAFTNNMDLSFTINLPYPAPKNNATSTENNNKTLKWTLNNQNKQTIEFEFDLYNQTASIIMTIGLIGFIAIILTIFLVIKNQKNKKENLTSNNQQTNNENINNLNQNNAYQQQFQNYSQYSNPNNNFPENQPTNQNIENTYQQLTNEQINNYNLPNQFNNPYQPSKNTNNINETMETLDQNQLPNNSQNSIENLEQFKNPNNQNNNF